MNSGIYRIVSPSGNEYIGSAKRFNRRFAKHRHELKKSIHHCKPLQYAANKYGIDALAFEILLVCKIDDLIFYEQLLIDSLNPRYNMCKKAGSALGIKRSAETCKKLSEANKQWIRTQEIRAAMSAGRKGMKLSEDHRNAIASGNRGKTMSEESRRKIGDGNRGKKRTDEQIKQMSEARKGKKPSEEIRQKLRVAQALRRERERNEAYERAVS